MFHWPYQFRRQRTFIVPKGPAFKRAPTLITCINGSEISLAIPPSKSGSYEKPLNPPKMLSLRDNDFKTFRIDKPEWEYFALVVRKWDFNGPWFTGNLARLSMYANVMRRTRTNSEISFFHPRAFEATIADLMTFYHGHELSRSNTVQDWFAPVDWRPITHLPCIAVAFDVTANQKVRRSERCRYLFLPLSDQYLLQISIPISRDLPFITSDTVPEDDTDAWISEEPMKELADQILDSLQVRLAPKAEQQQAKALERLSLEERGLVKEFPPLKWV